MCAAIDLSADTTSNLAKIAPGGSATVHLKAILGSDSEQQLIGSNAPSIFDEAASSYNLSSRPYPGESSKLPSSLYPPTSFPLIDPSNSIYGITAEQIMSVLDTRNDSAMPPSSVMFPWLHGLCPDNTIQMSLLDPQAVHAGNPPKVRSILLVRANIKARNWSMSSTNSRSSLMSMDSPQSQNSESSSTTASRTFPPGLLRGAIDPQDILPADASEPGFAQCKQAPGLNLRSFSSQVRKLALISDIVIYAPVPASEDDRTGPLDSFVMSGLLDLANRVKKAQLYHKSLILEKNRDIDAVQAEYNTFVVTSSFDTFELFYRNHVAVDLSGIVWSTEDDFIYRERSEISELASATLISPCVYLGNISDIEGLPGKPVSVPEVHNKYDVFIECVDGSKVPDLQVIKNVDKILLARKMMRNQNLATSNSNIDYESVAATATCVAHIAFPASGSMSLGDSSQVDVMNIVKFCEWIHLRSTMDHFRFLILCHDGYTETTFLAISYLIYTLRMPVHEAYITLHMGCKRPFFSFPVDVPLLHYAQTYLIARSKQVEEEELARPSSNVCELSKISHSEPSSTEVRSTLRLYRVPLWFLSLDGSFPSQIFDDLYLGNLRHANNLPLLARLNITKVLSVGEMPSWMEKNTDGMQGEVRIPECDTVVGYKHVNNVQDDGNDSILEVLDECIEYIEDNHRRGFKTLVHCRVGVSRSATVCIAAAMQRKGMTLADAYLYVRARRLNVIIQPNLKFMYELMLWEEKGSNTKRLHKWYLDWVTLCREIAGMNRLYMSDS
ncbi:hypothetical protein CANCADRAFT_94 [Tortispora caseinolytica NRRL Y-17796]|uniref:Uncharacterized protein n=1 Tax=Tortispora caseinolytica NRRL Y-17796 TaxID=767744 RepID=A0A1E4TIH0_9ASCO|nr:hypothetical protein CANCADRAFT_94 [Tortispora caseinolytica NRRL Y-17796]